MGQQTRANMSQTKGLAPTPTEGDLDKSSSSSSGPVNAIPSRDATSATSAAQQSDNIAHALAGAGGGLLAMTITKDQPHEGMWKSLNKIVKEEGWGGLYKGITPKVGQSVLTAAFLFAFKDVLYDMTVAARRKARAVKA